MTSELLKINMKGTEVPNPRRSSALVSCPDYFSPSRSEKYGLGTRLTVHVIVLVEAKYTFTSPDVTQRKVFNI